MTMPSIFFFVPDGDIEFLRGLDPDRDWQLTKRGSLCWTVQTWARLRAAGLDCELVSTVPRSGLVVFHNSQKRELRRQLHCGADVTLVGIRGDRREALIADFEFLQNGRFADERQRFFVPFWPQPGLIARDPARGDRVARAAFKGYDNNLHPALRSPEWVDFLRMRGIEWVTDSVSQARTGNLDPDVDWHDYRNVDLIVAFRPDATDQHTGKPATKLYNAWLAGVPALLGPEYAYRELRRSELDYFEITGLQDAKAAVEKLLAQPSLYGAMVANGRVRGREFTVDAITKRWIQLLTETIPAQVTERRKARWVPYLLRNGWRRVQRSIANRPAR
jgi:hypothetical protein